MAGDEHVTEATSGNTRFVQHNGLCLALLEVRILCYKQEVKSSVSITRGPAVCQTFCWAWGGAGSSGKLAAGPPGPWGVSSPSCRTKVLEVKAHVSFGRRIRGGLHRSSRLGHRQSRHRAVARAELRCPRRGRSAHTRRAGPPGPGSPWLLPKDFQLFCRGRRGPPCGGSVTGFLPPGGSTRATVAVLAVCPPRGGDSPLPLVFMPFCVTPRPRPDVQGGSPLGPAPRSSPSEDRFRLAGSCFPRPSSLSPSPR